MHNQVESLIKILRLRSRAFDLIGAAALSLFPASALAATCLPGADRSTERLLDGIDDDPALALRMTDTQLRQAQTPTQRAYLLGARAIALGVLSRNDDAAAAARSGRSLLPQSASVLRDALTILEAANSYHLDKAAIDLPVLRQILRKYPVGSELRVCAAGTAGDLERRAGDLVQAAHNLIDAYREARSGSDGRLTANTAHLLFKLVADAGDYNTALALNASGREYYSNRSARAKTVLLTVFRARLLNQRGDFKTALKLATTAEDMMRGRGDVVGDAYRSLEICRSLVGLAQLNMARQKCEIARHAFASLSESAAAQTDVLRARIALSSGRPQAAINLLNPVIAGPSSRSSSVDISEAYRLRAEAERQVGRSTAAFADLKEYVNRYRAWSDAARERQTVVAGVWLARDQQMLRASRAEARAARESLEAAKWLEWVRLLVISVVLAIVMLLALLVVGVRHRRHLVNMALADPLTGLPNRRGIVQFGDQALADAARTGSFVSFALIDLDHFKSINDTFGHATGDAVLQAFAQRAKATIPASCKLGRWGGEEFLGVFRNTCAVDAAMFLEQLRKSVENVLGPEIAIRFSAGVTDWNMLSDSTTCDVLIAQADAAAYQAKESGRNRTCFFEDEALALSDKGIVSDTAVSETRRGKAHDFTKSARHKSREEALEADVHLP